jgi:hypothetical protein
MNQLIVEVMNAILLPVMKLMVVKRLLSTVTTTIIAL